ncbi:uncharacterized protein V6R79_017962 [Siganus canaliculatus]
MNSNEQHNYKHGHRVSFLRLLQTLNQHRWSQMGERTEGGPSKRRRRSVTTETASVNEAQLVAGRALLVLSRSEPLLTEERGPRLQVCSPLQTEGKSILERSNFNQSKGHSKRSPT